MSDSSNQLNSQFTSILDDYNTFISRKQQKRLIEEKEEQEYLQKYDEVRKNIIEPTFVKLMQEAETRNYSAFIETEADVTDKSNLTENEKFITFILQLTSPDDVRLRYYYNSNHQPHLSFFCDLDSRKIRIHESTIGPGHGGHFGWKNEYELSEINERLVKKELVDWLESLIREATLSSYY